MPLSCIWEYNPGDIHINCEDVRPVVICSKCDHGEPVGVEYLCKIHSGKCERFGEDCFYKEYHSGDWFCADGTCSNKT